MKIARFEHQGKEYFGIIEEEKVRVMSGDPFGHYVLKNQFFPLNKIRLLAPCQPSKIVAVGLNYRDHAEEVGAPIPDEPRIFLKPSTAVVGPEESIVIPSMSRRVDYEAELAVVIKQRTRSVPPDKAMEAVLGYTCFNDVTARDLQKLEQPFSRAKGFDTFAPVGPWIATDVDPSDLTVECYLNGTRVQHSSTRHLIFGVDFLVSFISHVMTLLPGDIIATGTPSGIGPMKPGDRVEVVIQNVGRLSNPVTAEK
jgi:2-keto-4-pentenoate hydratase/2-oxohepta-3-ene-1,7-dioic acid hydratase in catechol pathway